MLDVQTAMSVLLIERLIHKIKYLINFYRVRHLKIFIDILSGIMIIIVDILIGAACSILYIPVSNVTFLFYWIKISSVCSSNCRLVGKFRYISSSRDHHMDMLSTLSRYKRAEKPLGISNKTAKLFANKAMRQQNYCGLERKLITALVVCKYLTIIRLYI